MGEELTEAQARALVQQSVWLAFGFFIVAGLAVYLATPRVDGEPRRWTLLMAWIQAWLDRRELRRALATPPPAKNEDRVSERGNAVNENQAETENTGKSAPGLTSAQLTKLLEDERRKAAAQALGTLLGAGLVVEEGRSRAMAALGFEGRRYTTYKPVVDQAEAVARAARPPAPPEEKPVQVLTIAGGTSQERLIPK